MALIWMFRNEYYMVGYSYYLRGLLFIYSLHSKTINNLNKNIDIKFLFQEENWKKYVIIPLKLHTNNQNNYYFDDVGVSKLQN